jgi:hypothetical protein
LKSLATSRPSGPSAESAFPGVSSPSTTSPGQAPCGARYQSRPGSALRLSQPLSGFLANPSTAALFHAATVPGVLPSESSPHRNRAPLSGPHAPLRLSTSVPDAASWTLSPPVSSDSHAFTQLPGFPRRLWTPFSRAEARFPVALDPSDGTRPFRQLHPLRSLDPPASPFALTRVAPSQRAAPLLGFCLSRAFSSHASESRPARTSRARACPFARRLRCTTRRTLTPPEPGETAPTRKHRSSLVDGFRSLGDRPAPPFGGVPSPMALELRAETLHP